MPYGLSLTNATERIIPEIEGNPVRNKLLLDLPLPECDSIFSQLTFVPLRSRDVLEEMASGAEVTSSELP